MLHVSLRIFKKIFVIIFFNIIQFILAYFMFFSIIFGTNGPTSPDVPLSNEVTKTA